MGRQRRKIVTAGAGEETMSARERLRREEGNGGKTRGRTVGAGPGAGEDIYGLSWERRAVGVHVPLISARDLVGRRAAQWLGGASGLFRETSRPRPPASTSAAVGRADVQPAAPMPPRYLFHTRHPPPPPSGTTRLQSQSISFGYHVASCRSPQSTQTRRQHGVRRRRVSAKTIV